MIITLAYYSDGSDKPELTYFPQGSDQAEKLAKYIAQASISKKVKIYKIENTDSDVLLKQIYPS